MAATETTERRGNKKVVIAALALVAAVALVGVGVFAAFNDTETTGVATEAGALDITGADDITIDELAPGDVAFRDLTIDIPETDNEGDLIRAIRLQVPGGAALEDTAGTPTDAGDDNTPTTLAGASLLTGSNGLRVLVANCVGGEWTLPGANTAIGTAGANGLYSSATCAGTVKVVQSEIPLNDLVDDADREYDADDFGVPATATGTIQDGTTLNLIAQFRLPTEAGNEYENASLTFDLLFEAVQRAGVNR